MSTCYFRNKIYKISFITWAALFSLGNHKHLRFLFGFDNITAFWIHVCIYRQGVNSHFAKIQKWRSRWLPKYYERSVWFYKHIFCHALLSSTRYGRYFGMHNDAILHVVFIKSWYICSTVTAVFNALWNIILHYSTKRNGYLNNINLLTIWQPSWWHVECSEKYKNLPAWHQQDSDSAYHKLVQSVRKR